MTLIKCNVDSYVNSNFINDFEVSTTVKRNRIVVTVYTTNGDSFVLYSFDSNNEDIIESLEKKVHDVLIPKIAKYIRLGVEVIIPSKIMEEN